MTRPAIGSPKHTGTQDAVLNAIKQGVSDTHAIATWLSLEIEQVRNAIKRLRYEGLIRRKNLGGYEPAVSRSKPLLADAWK